MNCGHMAGASGFSLIHFPLSIEQLKRSGPARRHSTPSAPAGLNFFGRRLMGGPENLPKRPGSSGAKTAWSFLLYPFVLLFFRSKFKAPKMPFLARFNGLCCY